MTSHDFDDAAALMGCGGVAHLVDRLDCSVACRVEADGVIRADNVKIDGPGHADSPDPVLRQFRSTFKGTVAADDHDCIDAMLPADIRRLLLAFLRLHFLAAGRIENGSAAVNDIRNALSVHVDDLFFKKT